MCLGCVSLLICLKAKDLTAASWWHQTAKQTSLFMLHSNFKLFTVTHSHELEQLGLQGDVMD